MIASSPPSSTADHVTLRRLRVIVMLAVALTAVALIAVVALASVVHDLSKEVVELRAKDQVVQGASSRRQRRRQLSSEHMGSADHLRSAVSQSLLTPTSQPTTRKPTRQPTLPILQPPTLSPTPTPPRDIDASQIVSGVISYDRLPPPKVFLDPFNEMLCDSSTAGTFAIISSSVTYLAPPPNNNNKILFLGYCSCLDLIRIGTCTWQILRFHDMHDTYLSSTGLAGLSATEIADF